MFSLVSDSVGSKNLIDDRWIKSTDETSNDSQQTQSTAMSDIIAVFILSRKSEIFWVCEIEPEYLEPHNSACKWWKPLSSSGALL